MADSRKEHIKRIEDLVDTVDTARIIADAEMTALCNEREFKKAAIFSSARDMLKKIGLSISIVAAVEKALEPEETHENQ